MSESTLAERLFAWRADEDSLFETVNKVLGCDPSKCLDEGFQWAAPDTFWDDYDGSVEVVMNPEWPMMTDEQASQILSLGFGQIYCSHGDTMTNFSRDRKLGTIHKWTAGKTHIRSGDDENQWRAKCNAMKSNCDRLRELADGLAEELEHYSTASRAYEAYAEFKNQMR